MAIRVLSVRARYAPAPLTQYQQKEWSEDATKCETLLNDAIKDGWKIIERWPSPDGNVLNIIIYKSDEKDSNSIEFGDYRGPAK